MRMPKPYYWKSRQAWFVNVNGQKKRLTPKGVGCTKTDQAAKDAALQEYHSLMANRQPVTMDGPAVRVLDLYLEHCHLNLAESTYLARRRSLESFARFIRNLRLSALKPYHVSAWINECHRLCKPPARKRATEPNPPDKETGPTYRHNLIRTVKAAFRWAEDEEYIERSPVRRVKLPTPRSRDVYLLPDQWDKLIALVAKSRDKGCLLDVITAMKETGCRPIEVTHVEAWHFKRADRCWEFPIDQSKGKRDSRVVLLTDRVDEICQRLALKYPEGPMFRNSDGTPWKRCTLGTRLNRASKKLGFHVCPYAIRHTFATDAIIRGVDLQTIATLMGHVDLKMLSRIYQHIRKRSDHLRAGLKKAVGE